MNGEVRNAKCDVLVCFAVKEEAQPFLACAAASRVRVMVTGMGGKNAEHAFSKFLESGRPEIVLSCGFAGGLNAELTTSDVVFSIDDNFPFKSNLLVSGAKPGIFHCAKRIAISSSEKRALRSQTGADAVEMESEVIRRMCAEQKIPSATVRVISDAANEDLPLDFNQVMTAEFKISYFRLALVVLLQPWKIPALIKFGKTTKAAAQNLSRVLKSLPI